jgi:YfiR/HmsC-like
MILAATLGHAADEAAAAVQQRVKAAFLYKFASYVEWPAAVFKAPDSPIVIGVSGADGVATELEKAVAGRRVADRPVTVQRLPAGAAAKGCCHILFVGGTAHEGGELLAAASGHGVLTVTEASGALPRGSVINFLEADNRVRFDISREAAERNGLQVRAQLLAVARDVVTR